MFLSELAVFTLENPSGHSKYISLGSVSFFQVEGYRFQYMIRCRVCKGAGGVLRSLLCLKSSMSFPCLKSLWTSFPTPTLPHPPVQKTGGQNCENP